MPAARHSVLDVVELLTESGRWPAGTVGTVVEADDHLALVEVDDEHGHALDFVSLPHDVLAAAGERATRAAS
jgi:hypothetical protein